jgi:hypothetical protein
VIVPEGAQRLVVEGADEAAETARTTAFRGMAVEPGAAMTMIDREARTERLATDRAAPVLGLEHGPDLDATEPLTLGRRLPWICGV